MRAPDLTVPGFCAARRPQGIITIYIYTLTFMYTGKAGDGEKRKKALGRTVKTFAGKWLIKPDRCVVSVRGEPDAVRGEGGGG